MKQNEMTMAEIFVEAVGLVSGVLYIGLQIYYGVLYGAGAFGIILNVAALLLVYAGLTLLTVYPEKVNGLTREACSGKVRRYTVWMVRIVKLIFVANSFTSICDVLGHEINAGYSLVVVALIVITAVIFEGKIIKILRNKNGKLSSRQFCNFDCKSMRAMLKSILHECKNVFMQIFAHQVIWLSPYGQAGQLPSVMVSHVID